MKIITSNPVISSLLGGKFYDRADRNGKSYVSKHSGHEYHAYNKDDEPVDTLDGYRKLSNGNKSSNNISECFNKGDSTERRTTRARNSALKNVYEAYDEERFFKPHSTGTTYDLGGSDPTGGFTVNNEDGTTYSWSNLNGDETKCRHNDETECRHCGEGISFTFQKRKEILEKSLLNAPMPTMASQPPPMNSPPSIPTSRSTSQSNIQMPPTTPSGVSTLSIAHQTPVQQQTEANMKQLTTLMLSSQQKNQEFQEGFQGAVEGALKVGEMGLAVANKSLEVGTQALSEGRVNNQNVTHLNYRQGQDQILLSNTINEVVALKCEMEILKEAENVRRGGMQQKIDPFKDIVHKVSLLLGKSIIVITVPASSISYLTLVSFS